MQKSQPSKTGPVASSPSTSPLQANKRQRHSILARFLRSQHFGYFGYTGTRSFSDSELSPTFRLLSLEPLARMKLTSFRPKDQMHLLDMLGVGLIDATWPPRFPPQLAARLQEILDHPEG